MSIAGSVPDASRPVLPETPAKRTRGGLFRWRALVAVALVVALLIVGWILFGDRILARSLAEAGTNALGVQVDIERAHFDPIAASLELTGFAIANPLDSSRNIVEIPSLRVVLVPDALLLKKIAIRELNVTGARANTPRATMAQPPVKNGFAYQSLKAMQEFRAQFNVPLLSLTPIDTIKAIALDPAKLASVQAAKALASRADSTQRAIASAIQALRLRETADSAEALMGRLKGQTPRSLGLAGTRGAVADVRRLAARVDSAKKGVERLQSSARQGVDSLVAAVRAVDDARKADYEFAKGLMKLPTFDAPNIGPALFGEPSIDAVQRAMYWVMLAREYAPPGLLPREQPGPRRLRRAGTTVAFVAPRSYPQFLLQKGTLTLSLDGTAGAAQGSYKLEVRDVTTQPALIGRPVRFALTRTGAGRSADSITVTGVLDHTRQTPNGTIDVRAVGLSLPSFALPAPPARIVLGRGASTLRLTTNGAAINGKWSAAAPSVTWAVDSTRLNRMGFLERLVTNVITGIDDVSIDAEIGGTVKSPTLAVRSNLDRAVADNIKRVAGEQIAIAETKVRALVDAEAERALAPMRAKIAEAKAEAEARVTEARDRLEKAKSDLAAQLKTLSGGLLGG